MIFRQGDVLIEKVAGEPPKRAKKVAAQNGQHILARGEVTGHAHTVEADEAELLIDDDGLMFLRVMNKAVLHHQEHAPLILPRGIYRINRQREYTPAEVRRVAD